MNFPDLKNKTVSISIKEDTFSHDLVNPYFETQGGRLFIIGKIPKESTDSEWNSDKIGAVAWDSVTEYTVFDSYEEYQKATKKSENHNKKENKDT